MKIAIWGLGVSGLATVKYLARKTKNTIYLINQGEPESWSDWSVIKNLVSKDQCFNQDKAFMLKDKIDKIILSPGIDPRIEALQHFKYIEKICDVELVFKDCDIPLIAVTGTNGKTTTCTIITEALKKYGKNVFLGGNIGIPACEFFLSEKKFDVAVLELSSFQIELLKDFHPQIAVILNIDKSHMERYDHVDDYKNAKLLLAKNLREGDYFIAPSEFHYVGKNAHQIKVKKSEKLQFEKMKCVGEHYKSTYFIVETILEYLNISDLSPLQELVNEFPGVHYRIEYIKEYKGLKIYNDGKSTNTASTVLALNQFKHKRVALLLGGKLRDKSQELKDILDVDCKLEVFSFGDAASYIQKTIGGKKFENLKDCLIEVIKNDFDVLLFSPAFPSFDQYKNYIERAESFNQIIEELTPN